MVLAAPVRFLLLLLVASITNALWEEKAGVVFFADGSTTGVHQRIDEVHHKILVFPSSRWNRGQAYNQFNGVFTAPIGGVYSFSVTIDASKESSEPRVLAYLKVAHAHIQKGDSIITEASGSRTSSGSVTANIALAKGDQIFVAPANRPADFHASSSFSGVLISPDE